MKKGLSEAEKQYLEHIDNYTNSNPRLKELFSSIPNMTIETYKKTAIIYATKKYEEVVTANQTIPHGFYAIIEESIIKDGVLKTLRTYKKDLELICETMEMDIKDLQKIFLDLRPIQNPTLVQKEAAQKAHAKLKEIIRKSTSKYKETYIKRIITEKTEQLKNTTIKAQSSQSSNIFSGEMFLNYILSNPILKKRIESIIFEKLGLVVDENKLKEIITATSKKNYKNDLTAILGIKKPIAYEEFLKTKYINRLHKNFAPKLNSIYADASIEQKSLIVKILKYKVKCKKNNSNQDSEEFNQIKPLIKKVNMALLEEISSVMVQASSDVELVDGQITFNAKNKLNDDDIKECSNYNQSLKKIRSLHNDIYTLYKEQIILLTSFLAKTIDFSTTEEETYEIDKDKWLDYEKIRNLIESINISAINNMSEQAFRFLKNFLINEGLLWAYLANNIQLKDILKIINNFQATYACLSLKDLTIDNISEIIKNANLYDYIDDLSVGLVGLDILSKIINYNQFSGVTLTPEDIKKRIRKVIDLSVRAERTPKSSLPFNCDVKYGDYSLRRYHNNDPEIFTSGIDTKTCFFVSVNENDFFFFSLLHKDGYVIKIVDKDNNLIARATCFRKNNVLMINGIRCLNNKVIPESQEDLEQFANIVKLIELMAKKIINLTTSDACPIDYVVCNKAGILENDFFSNRFENINSDLFREPINVYSAEWQEFVHLYDSEEEQLLQEVPYAPDKSFTTDFGNHYPAIMITSRNNMALTSPRHISLEDQPDTYIRPRKHPEEYISDEIDENILVRINRIRALACFTGSKEEQERKKAEYRLLKKTNDIKSIIIGEDWLAITLKNDKIISIFANENRQAYVEFNYYVERFKQKNDYTLEESIVDHDIKVYEPNFKKN